MKGLNDSELVWSIEQFIESSMNQPEGRDGERPRFHIIRKKFKIEILKMFVLSMDIY